MKLKDSNQLENNPYLHGQLIHSNIATFQYFLDSILISHPAFHSFIAIPLYSVFFCLHCLPGGIFKNLFSSYV